MSADILINLPLVNQKTDTGDKKWANKTCGVCSLKMVLGYLNPKHKKLKVMSLVKKGLKKGGYMKNIGWKHSALVDLAADYGVKMRFQKIFLKKKKEKEGGLKFIIKNIKRGKPVIASVHYGFNPRRNGHLVAVNGVRISGKRVFGFYIQDPYPTKKGNNYFVTKAEFLKGWRGGMIWLK